MAKRETMREKLANLCHEQWSGWMGYLFGKGTFNDDGTWTMPAWAVERWRRQAETPYAELSAEEKDNDRAEADRFIALIKGGSVPALVIEDPSEGTWGVGIGNPNPTLDHYVECASKEDAFRLASLWAEKGYYHVKFGKPKHPRSKWSILRAFS